MNIELISCIALHYPLHAEDSVSLSGLDHSFTRIASSAAAACIDESWQYFNLPRIKNSTSYRPQFSTEEPIINCLYTAHVPSGFEILVLSFYSVNSPESSWQQSHVSSLMPTIEAPAANTSLFLLYLCSLRFLIHAVSCASTHGWIYTNVL